MSLLLHRGGEACTLEDLRTIPLPEETETYKPVSHYDLVTNLAKVASGILHEYEMEDAQFGVAREGQRMFGVLTYRNGISNEMGLSIGFRNSYDRTMSVGIALGASVFVCDNLALTGEITVMRKHTSNVIQDLENMIVTTIYKSQKNFMQIMEDAEIMRQRELSDDDAFSMIGRLYGKDVLTPRQIPVMRQEWLEPSHEEFTERNLWSFYNAATEALKSSPPNRIMERHLMLHDFMNAVA